MEFFSGMSEQEEVGARQLARERFEAIFAPLATYCEAALRCLDPENQRAVAETSDTLRRSLQPRGDAVALLILLHAVIGEGEGWYLEHLAPLEAGYP